ncbi:DUF6789 family protein [Brevundimonas sp.]|uniref:DUF6789 family protein n=1 Tax=Brevundimonas sp. TaxID=1871086 RepID=UPI0035B1370C
MQSQFKMGAIAGFAASIAVAAMEVVNMFALPTITEFPTLLATIAGMPDQPAVGWVLHILAGTLILGPAFAYVAPRLPTDTSGTKGILFSVAAWILMMFTVAPMADLGLFAVRAGFSTIAWMLAIHVVFGIVLGTVYGEQRKKARAAERAAASDPGAAAAA